MTEQTKGTKRPMNTGAFKRVFSVLVVLLLASVLMVGAGSAGEMDSANVAKIGETGYATLSAAIEAATDSTTIVTLLANIELTEQLTLTKGVTIDGDGKTISVKEGTTWGTEDSNKHFILITSKSPVTLKNLKLDAKGIAGDLHVYDTGAQNQIVLKNLHINGSNMMGLHVNAANVSATGLTIENSKWLVGVDVQRGKSGEGLLETTSVFYIDTLDKISDSIQISDEELVDSGAKQSTSSVYINGVKADAALLYYNNPQNSYGYKLQRYGWLNETMASLTCEASVQTAEKPVALHASFSAAINSAETGATVYLLSDVTLTENVGSNEGQVVISKDLTLDGNGYTILSAYPTPGITAHLMKIAGEYTVTIKNVTLDSDKKVKGINVYGTAGQEQKLITFQNVHFKNSTGNGLTVSSHVVMEKCIIEESGWEQSIDLGIGSGAARPISLVLDSESQLMDPLQVEIDDPELYGEGEGKCITVDIPETYVRYDVYDAAKSDKKDDAHDKIVFAESVPDTYPVVVGNNLYADLSLAVSEAEGETVTLLDDVTLSDTLTLADGVTIDGGDNTLTVPQITAAGTATIQNLNVEQKEGTSADTPLISLATTEAGANVAITGSTIIPVTGNTAISVTPTVADATYDIAENNIEGTLSVAVSEDAVLTTPIDVSKNAWAGSGPQVEQKIGEESTTDLLVGTDIYYETTDDGKVDTDSAVTVPIAPATDAVTSTTESNGAVTIVSGKVTYDNTNPTVATIDYGSVTVTINSGASPITETGTNTYFIPAGSTIIADYPEAGVAVNSANTGVMTYDLDLGLKTVVKTLPEINADFKTDVAGKVGGDVTVLGMITGENQGTVTNDNYTQVTIVFKIPKSWVPANTKFVAYHIDGSADPVSCTPNDKGSYYEVTVTSTFGFSSYAVGYTAVSTGGNGGGSSSSSGSSVWLQEPVTPTEQPTQTPTEQPTDKPTDTVPTDIPSTQPTATPSTPGFGVLAVLAGLGAVAVLRRQ